MQQPTPIFTYRLYALRCMALVLLMALILPAPSHAQGYIHQSQRYIDCTVQSQHQPALALASAQTWLAESRTPSAMHCKALALYNLEQYDKSAALLVKLQKALPDSQAPLKTSILLQAAHTYSKADNKDAALDALSTGIALSTAYELQPENIALLRTRAALYQHNQSPHKALQDLDNILALDPEDKKALLKRARLFEILEKDQLAEEDFSQLLMLENTAALLPDNQ